MSPDIRPPTQAEIEEALKKQRSEIVGNGNSEIGKALLEFEKQQGGVTYSPVNDSVDVMRSQKIEIPQDSYQASKMVGRLMKWSGGAIKNERQAEYVLLGIAVVFMIVSMFLFFGGGSGGGTRDVDPRLPAIFHPK